MDWVPIVFLTFKLVVFGVCMFFAIKWHYDQGKKKQQSGEAPKPAAKTPKTPD